MKKIQDLRDQLLTVAKLGSALAVLGWDQEVNLPSKGLSIRGEINSMLAADIHRRVTSPEFVMLVKSLAAPKIFKTLSGDEQVIVRETWRDVQRAQKLPVKFVEEFAKLSTDAFAAWAAARQKSDFLIFKPYLKKVVKMSRQEAEYIGYKDSPYDALLDGFEPGMTSKRLDELFVPLAKELSSLIIQAKNNNLPELPKFKYEISAQQNLNEIVAGDLGYDLEAGRIDESPHPFTINFHPTDVRITTRYDENDFWVSLGSVIHEVGHALYEQGLPTEEFGTPLGSSVSLGVHESQSRIWENFVGRSRAFVDYLYPLMQKHFGKLPYKPEELHLWLNRVQPSLIRVESDEVTYNLHIMVRYELEKAMIENRLEVDDLPQAWSKKMEEYLGVKVPNDAKGVLQDIHWSHGTLGYFPTYSLGNLYAAQLFSKISQDIPNLQKKFADGDFKPFLKWLRQNIHQYGRRYQPEELIQLATGEPLNTKYLWDHLRERLELNR
ncbi:MAG: carboxypeptidase M32 [bacterium]|nr:carboxypeptidase M32 [bacterium]